MKKITLSLLVIISLFLNSCTEFSGFKELDYFCGKKILDRFSSKMRSGKTLYFFFIESNRELLGEMVKVEKRTYFFYEDKETVDCSYGLAKF